MSRTYIWFHWCLLFKSDNASINLYDCRIYWGSANSDLLRMFHTSSLDFNAANKMFFFPLPLPVKPPLVTCNMSHKRTLLSLWRSSLLPPEWGWSKSGCRENIIQNTSLRNVGVFLLFWFLISVASVFYCSLLRLSKTNIKGHASPLKS